MKALKRRTSFALLCLSFTAESWQNRSSLAEVTLVMKTDGRAIGEVRSEAEASERGSLASEAKVPRATKYDHALASVATLIHDQALASVATLMSTSAATARQTLLARQSLPTGNL